MNDRKHKKKEKNEKYHYSFILKKRSRMGYLILAISFSLKVTTFGYFNYDIWFLESAEMNFFYKDINDHWQKSLDCGYFGRWGSVSFWTSVWKFEVFEICIANSIFSPEDFIIPRNPHRYIMNFEGITNISVEMWSAICWSWISFIHEEYWHYSLHSLLVPIRLGANISSTFPRIQQEV